MVVVERVIVGSTDSRDIGDIFGFLSNSDILVVLDSGVLDRETSPAYIFTVVAEDSIGQQSTATVTVILTDINDVTPEITTTPG